MLRLEMHGQSPPIVYVAKCCGGKSLQLNQLKSWFYRISAAFP